MGARPEGEGWSLRTRCIHVGNDTDPATGAVVPPIYLASTFVQHHAGEWREYDYSRSGNPTRTSLQTTLASIEGGCGALAFASGMAAIHAVTMLLHSGDHILAGSDLYGGAYRLFHKICDRAGVNVSLVNKNGSIDYKAALLKFAPDADLEAFRKKATQETRVTIL